MSGFREPNFGDRQKAAAEARKALLERFKSQPGPDDPGVQARAAQRAAAAEAREQARIAREARKVEEKRLAEIAAAEEAARLAREAEEAAEREIQLEAARKAARDERYAARKKRNKKR